MLFIRDETFNPGSSCARGVTDWQAVLPALLLRLCGALLYHACRSRHPRVQVTKGKLMGMSSSFDLLRRLVAATKPSDVQIILEDLGDRPYISVNVPFSGGYYWHFYGNKESNMSSINLAAKPGRSLTERITNAIDAVIEKRVAKATGNWPASPMEAAGRYFGRPPSTADNGLYAWKTYLTQGYDRLVQVILTDEDKDTEPTIDVVDDGIGISPAAFADTIVSLQEANKIKKRYVSGAWGQGGSSTLAFSEYVLIVSRHVDDPKTIGFTIVKLLDLPDPYKENAYVYLAVEATDGSLTVPSCSWDGPIELYPGSEAGVAKPQGWNTGTAVRHYGYTLGNDLNKTLASSPGNLYHLLHYTMFDSLMPFRVVDLRTGRAPKNELVTGSRNRLMNLLPAGGEEADPESAEGEASGTTLRHHSPREMVSPRAGESATIGIEYWVVLNYRKRGEKMVLRSRSSELYVSSSHPIVGTLNGQNQGELTGRILNDLKLSMVAKHMVIHIDATEAERDIRRELFTSTREGFKDGEVLTELTRVLANRLAEDETLQEIERELVGQLLRSETSEAKNAVRTQITGLLRDAGLRVLEPGEVLVAGGDGRPGPAPPRPPRPPRPPAVALRTLPYPQVTRFEIVYPRGVLRVALQDNQVVRVETDADFRFGREKRLAIRAEPPKLEIASQGLLQGGRMNWRLRPAQGAQVGDRGEIVATITKPDGSQLETRLPYEILPVRQEPTKTARGMVPAFDVRQVHPVEDAERFEQIWDNLGPEDDKSKVAYKVLDTPEGLIVYYSTAFGPYKEQVDGLIRQPTLTELFAQNYAVWIGYHAILQWQQRSTASSMARLEDEELAKIQEHDRAVVATMQVKQALKMAELQAKTAQQNIVE